jgi:hypothetical protein
MKACTSCGVVKPPVDFHRQAERPDGRREICKECIAHRAKEYRERNREKVAESKKRWVARNQERAREISRRHRSKGVSLREVRERSPEVYARMEAKWAKRRADRVLATPIWFDPEKVRYNYLQAGRMRRAGHDVHVDHIIPLRGELVCGLHVHNNLRIIPAKENISKGTKLLDGLAEKKMMC